MFFQNLLILLNVIAPTKPNRAILMFIVSQKMARLKMARLDLVMACTICQLVVLLKN